MLSQGHMGTPLHRYTGQVVPRFGNSISLVNSKNGAIASRLRLISTSDCSPHPHQTYTKCLSHWYAVSRAYGCTLIPLRRPSWPQIWEVRVTWSENDAITSWLRLISTSNHFIHPYQTYKKCLSHWYAVSREYGCTLMPLHWPSWPQIWEVRVTCGVKMMPQRHG